MKKIIHFVLVTFCLFSCGSNNFYSPRYDSPIARIPMIKPYQFESADSGNNWSMELKNHIVVAPKYIGVKNQTFVVIAEGMGGRWYIVDTKIGSEMVFTSEKDYKKTLDSLKLNDVKLYETGVVFRDFAKEDGSLPQEWPHE